MTDRYVVVLDAGTTRVRCFLFDQRAQIVASGSIEWSYLPSKDSSPLAREFDPSSLWSGICRLVQDTIRGAGTPPERLAAITATSQRQGIVLLDAKGGEIYAGPNLDLRAVFEGGAIDEQMRDRVYETTGHIPSFLFAPAKLRWFQQHRPEAYDRIASVLTLADWLVYRLSGVMVSEPTLAGDAGLLDIRRRHWCSDLLGDLGLGNNSHVPLVTAGTAVGRVAQETSRETGVPVGTPVVVSGADTQCGLLGMGVCREREVGVVAGWSAPLQMVLSRPIFAQSAKTWSGCFLTPDGWVLESSAGDAGNSYRWLADILWGRGTNPFSEMDALAAAVPAGSDQVLAFLGPSRMDMGRLGLRQGGILFPVPMTLSEPNRGRIVRAALEAMAYAIYANLQQAEDVAGTEAEDVSLGGGMIQTATSVRIVADVLGRQINVSPTPHVSALGAYLCAQTAIGEFASLEEAAESISRLLRAVEPDTLAHSEYKGHYQRWLQLASQLQGSNP